MLAGLINLIVLPAHLHQKAAAKKASIALLSNGDNSVNLHEPLLSASLPSAVQHWQLSLFYTLQTYTLANPRILPVRECML